MRKGVQGFYRMLLYQVHDYIASLLEVQYLVPLKERKRNTTNKLKTNKKHLGDTNPRIWFVFFVT